MWFIYPMLNAASLRPDCVADWVKIFAFNFIFREIILGPTCGLEWKKK